MERPQIGVAIFHGIGDILNATIVARELKTRHPDCDLVFFTAKRYAFAIENNPYIDTPVLLDADPLEMDKRIAELKRQRAWVGFYTPAPYMNYHHKQDGTLSELLQASIGGRFRVPFHPVVSLYPEEVEQARHYLRSLGNRPKVLFETEFLSDQSPWTPRYLEFALELLSELDALCIVTSKNKPDWFDRLQSTYPHLVWCGIPFRLNAELFNGCDAFIGVSSGISCLTFSSHCRTDVPRIELVCGPHWSSIAYNHHSRKVIVYSEKSYRAAIEWLVAELTLRLEPDTLKSHAITTVAAFQTTKHAWFNTPPAELVKKIRQERFSMSQPTFHLEEAKGRYRYYARTMVPYKGEFVSGIEDIAAFLDASEPFYLHVGGVGDALLLLATFYDREPQSRIVSFANDTSALSSFFDCFPQLEAVDFIGEANPYFGVALARHICSTLSNCKGMGVSPKQSYRLEWHKAVNIEAAFSVNRTPAWAHAFRRSHDTSGYLVLAPKGSLFGMPPWKSNRIPDADWSKILHLCRQKGLRPVVIGTPDEEKLYPLDSNCIDERSYSFGRQMEVIASAGLVIAADSWHKTFAGLVGAETLVFPSIINKEVMSSFPPEDQIDYSEHVFIDGWPAVRRVGSLTDIELALDRLARVEASQGMASSTGTKPNPARDIKAKSKVLTSFSPRFWTVDYESLKRVHVSVPDALGDSLTLTSVIASLARNYPHLHISIDAARPYVDVFDGHPNVHNIAVKGSGEDTFLIMEADCHLDYNDIVGRLPEYYNGIGYKDIFGNLAGIPFDYESIVYQRAGSETHLVRSKVGRLLSYRYRIAIHLQTSKDPKRSYPYTTQLITLLLESNKDLVIVGLGTEGLGHVHERVFDCASESLSLREQIALVGECSHFVGVDSGFFHVAHNLWMKPTLLLAGLTNPQLVGNPKRNVSVISNTELTCLNCYWSKPCQIECMTGLSPVRVQQEIEMLLRGDRATAGPDLPIYNFVIDQPDYERVLAERLYHAPTYSKCILTDPHGYLPDYAERWNGVIVRRTNGDAAQTPFAGAQGGDRRQNKSESEDITKDIAVVKREEVKTELLVRRIAGQEVPTGFERIACPYCHSDSAKAFRGGADIVKCNNCGTVYLRTRYTAATMEALYQTYADGDSHMAIPANRAAASASGLRRPDFMDRILTFTSPGGKSLDIGCGWGAFLLEAQERGFTPQGIELTRKCAEFAHSVLGIPVSTRQFIETPLEANTFRLVTMIHVLEHLPEPKAALSRVVEVLEHQGIFAGIVPNIESLGSQVLREAWPWIDAGYHYVHYSPKTLRDHLETAGLTVLEMYTTSGDYSHDAVSEILTKAREQYPALVVGDLDTRIAELEQAGFGEEIRFIAQKVAAVSEDVHSPEFQPEDEPYALYLAGDIDEAIAVATAEILAKPAQERLTELVRLLALIAGQEGDAEGMQAFVEKIPNADEHPDTTYVRALLEMVRGDNIRALELLTQILDTWADTLRQTKLALTLDEVLVVTAQALWASNDQDGAFQLYEQALQLNPGNAAAAFGLGLYLRQNGEGQQSEEFFSIAISLNPAYQPLISEVRGEPGS